MGGRGVPRLVGMLWVARDVRITLEEGNKRKAANALGQAVAKMELQGGRLGKIRDRNEEGAV